MNTRTIAKNESIVGSQVVYKRNSDGSANARIVRWRHRDQDKYLLCGDAPSVSFELLHLIPTLAVEHKWTVQQMNI